MDLRKKRDTEVRDFIRMVRRLADASGLKIMTRIEVMDTRTGKTYL